MSLQKLMTQEEMDAFPTAAGVRAIETLKLSTGFYKDLSRRIIAAQKKEQTSIDLQLPSPGSFTEVSLFLSQKGYGVTRSYSADGSKCYVSIEW